MCVCVWGGGGGGREEEDASVSYRVAGRKLAVTKSY